MTSNLADLYSDYIACLNAQDWENLGRFVHPDVVHNARPLGLHGYRCMLEADYRAIPDLRFAIEFLVIDPPKLAARLAFNCTPVGEFLGLAVNGTRISFAENVFYAFEDGRIREVWSVIDKVAIEAQLRAA
ncbi:ester cyclase [Pseudomonas brassicacearum]|uniref:ester cyclase n=1 Tax=Pseudomonas brassicacearum TaxID=930166 RepID=UPI000F464A00|nr:ester cyclase [Pseudomonas brassicacearum]ROM83029.1 ester cyclase [Pseudomonas brassicacearum]